MRRANRPAAIPLGSRAALNHDDDHQDAAAATQDVRYLTYRPLSNLPTPPPTYKEPPIAGSADDCDCDSSSSQAKFRGPAIHLVNLIPSSASLATASVPLVQSMLSRANLPLETVALAVCVLDSLDSRFARAWRLCCPLLHPDVAAPPNKRHTLPPTPPLPRLVRHQQQHIDSVRPELIILAALVIAAKFTEDPQQPTQFYCLRWGKALWSHCQLNATERCIMESLNYRIMPLCDQDYLADAMVDMQLAARQGDHNIRDPSPPTSNPGSDDDVFVPGHGRSQTVAVVESPAPR
ncbi:hypothetical protein L249_4166 [Ophiocordyceps polyrhachis-furcata BCC 54312]|uniref:Uncharacterized protein n=1 Tax=Ophiocordyceps polyrhachis-furcata BCC 54312 TaxID=1330021 RepID=A0A367L5D7_9HYPO|nr:hypothetical protein L249_4166 [Ophiocordyceps polyrhachis-furcata BCC 54312]